MTNTFNAMGKNYAIDMEAFMAFVSNVPSQEKPISTTINQYYDKGVTDEGVPNHKDGINLDMQSKEVNETKSNASETFVNIRYDFARQLLTMVLNPMVDANGEIMENLTFGQTVALTTLIYEGIIIERGDEE